MLYLTVDQHREVVARLIGLAREHRGCKPHAAGIEYTSLMVCFMMHCIGAAESLTTFHAKYGHEWFPVTTGYVIARSMFEVDVNAHYLAMDRANHTRRYIDFEHVIRKNTLERIERHRTSSKTSWREGLQEMYNAEYAPRKIKIEADYNRVRAAFEDAKGRRATWWHGKSLHAIAKEVGHEEAYDIFYADLSSFTHVNVMMANRFLALKDNGPTWSMRSTEGDVGGVFRYAATFLTCFLQLFGKEFGVWDDKRVTDCWDFPTTSSA